MSKIRVYLVDDHTMIRDSLKYRLKEEEGIEVVGEAENGHRLLQDVEKVSPDVIVLDISMPLLNGLEAVVELKKLVPETKILILTMHTDEEKVYQAFNFGASGYLVKKAAVEDLVTAIRAVHRGETYISSIVSDKVVQAFVRNTRRSEESVSPDKLTSRERQILKLIAEGWTSIKIAEHLHIASRTVETHRANIMQKLKLHKIADLVKYAIRRGMVEVEP